MRVGIHTWGSEGDLQPFFSLADGLVAKGHQVELVYCPVDGRDYANRLAQSRFEHHRIESGRSPDELRSIGGEIFADPNPLRQMRRTFAELLDPVIDGLAATAKETANRCDLLVLHPVAHPLAAAATHAGKRFATVYLAPMLPTSSLPPPGAPSLGPLNRALWSLSLWLVNRTLRPSLTRARQTLGLGPISRLEDQLQHSSLDLVAMSPTLLRRPPDWPDKTQVVGAFSPVAMPSPLDPALERFLMAGEPPIYVTFGSMSAAEHTPDEVWRIVTDAAVAANVRAVIQSGSPERSTQHVLHVGPCAHAAAFPRCAAIVHHGGVGTTQAALRAGRPSVVVAHFGDQTLWGRQLRRLGVAPPHLERRTLNAPALARAIAVATRTPAMANKAVELAHSMANENGVAQAVTLLEGLAR